MCRYGFYLDLVITLPGASDRNVPRVLARRSIDKLGVGEVGGCVKPRIELGDHSGLLIPDRKDGALSTLQAFHRRVSLSVYRNCIEMVFHLRRICQWCRLTGALILRSDRYAGHSDAFTRMGYTKSFQCVNERLIHRISVLRRADYHSINDLPQINIC